MTDRRVGFRSQSALNLSSPIETAANILIQMTPHPPSFICFGPPNNRGQQHLCEKQSDGSESQNQIGFLIGPDG